MFNVADKFQNDWNSQQGVASNPLLSIHHSRIVEVLRFIDTDSRAAKLKSEIEGVMKTTNWLLDPKKLETFAQTVGEAQFWQMAHQRGVHLERIPEQGKNKRKTPDFRLAGGGANAPCFEVKTLSVVSSVTNLVDINETSFEAQLDLSKQISAGKQIATAINEVSPHGEVKDGKPVTAMIDNLQKKASNNIKSGQFSDAPTCLVLNLLLIDGKYNGNASLRPVMSGYPAEWNVMSGIYWALAFGRIGHLVFGIPEFEEKPSVEGLLGRDGILIANPNIAALFLVVHDWNRGPSLFGLKRECDSDLWQNERKDLAETFFKLVGTNWNDEGDTNGWQLTEY